MILVLFPQKVPSWHPIDLELVHEPEIPSGLCFGGPDDLHWTDYPRWGSYRCRNWGLRFIFLKKKDFQLVEYVPRLRTAGVTSQAPLIWVLSSVDQVQTSPEPSCSLTFPAISEC